MERCLLLGGTLGVGDHLDVHMVPLYTITTSKHNTKCRKLTLFSLTWNFQYRREKM